jgi:alpha-mannosidase
VALLSESKYGFSTFDNNMRISLLRAPKDPDPNCDMGEHEFAYAIMPHTGSWQQAGVVGEAFRFNNPVVWARANASLPARSFARVDDRNLVLDTVKKAEDSDALVLRFYEAHGARGTAKVHLDLPFTQACYCNILEDSAQPVVVNGGVLEIPYTPFKIITVKVS